MNDPTFPPTALRPFLLALAILVAAATGESAAGTVHKVGAVTWHPKRYVGRVVDLVGYPLARNRGYALFSDEARGKISAHDLPVVGKGVAGLRTHMRYRIRGKFVRGGLHASNGNPYHLELTAAPVPAPR